MNALPGYDAWRLTPPDDRPCRRARFAPSDVTTPLCIEIGDVQIDAIGTYDADTCELLSVKINGSEVSVNAVSTAMRLLRSDYEHWADDLDPAKRDELVSEAAQDAEAAWADSRRDFMEDR